MVHSYTQSQQTQLIMKKKYQHYILNAYTQCAKTQCSSRSSTVCQKTHEIWEDGYQHSNPTFSCLDTQGFPVASKIWCYLKLCKQDRKIEPLPQQTSNKVIVLVTVTTQPTSFPAYSSIFHLHSIPVWGDKLISTKCACVYLWG